MIKREHETLRTSAQPGRRLLPLLTALALACAAPALGCGDDEDNSGTSGDGDGGDGDKGDGDGGDGDGGDGDIEPAPKPLYAIATQLASGDSGQWVSKLVLVESLSANKDTQLKAEGTSVNGRALVMGPVGKGLLYVASDDGPTVTEYKLAAGDKLEKGRTLSFLPRGISGFTEYAGQFVFVSETKGYVFEGSVARAVVWNPKEMKLGNTISLENLVLEKHLLSFSNDPILLDDKVIQFAGFREGLVVPAVAAVVSIDTKTDTATVVKDERCGYVRNGVLAEDGMIYMATEAFASAVHYLNDTQAPAPCLLRFDPETNTFDENFKVDLNGLFDGKATGTLLAGPDGRAYVKVLDPSLVPEGTTHGRVLASSPVWKWGTLTLGDTPSGKSIAGDATLGSVMPFHFDGVTYAPLFWNNERTSFQTITEDGLGDDNVGIPGVVFSVAKIR